MEHCTEDILSHYLQKNQEVYLEQALAGAKQIEEYLEQFEEVCPFFSPFYLNIHSEDNYLYGFLILCMRIILEMMSMTTNISTAILHTQMILLTEQMTLVSLSNLSAGARAYRVKPFFQHRRKETEQILQFYPDQDFAQHLLYRNLRRSVPSPTQICGCLYSLVLQVKQCQLLPPQEQKTKAFQKTTRKHSSWRKTSLQLFSLPKTPGR
jgi:hypothetical protein